MEDPDRIFKLIVLGSGGSGKTCLIRRYCSNTFNENTKTTLGFDFLGTRITWKEMRLEFKIWDTVGHDAFNSLTRMYYKGTHGALLVYDITNAESFEKVKYWLEDLRENGSGLERVVIVGNKSDISIDRKVGQMDAKTFASEEKLKWLECSAKTGKNVTEAFKELIDQVLKEYENNNDFKMIGQTSTIIHAGNSNYDRIGRSGIILGPGPKKKKACC